MGCSIYNECDDFGFVVSESGETLGEIPEKNNAFFAS
jgi:hypothetical protein